MCAQNLTAREVSMTLLKRERLDVPLMMRELFDGGWETSWLRLEEFRDGDTYVMRVEMPDVDPEKDVEITVDGDMMHIHAEKEEKTEDTGKDGYRSEFRYGSFSRDMRVPVGTKPDDVKATYTDGVLEIRVPAEAGGVTPPAKIPVTRS
jgi:HSP20 family protein